MQYKVLKPVGEFEIGQVADCALFPEGRAEDLVEKGFLELCGNSGPSAKVDALDASFVKQVQALKAEVASLEAKLAVADALLSQATSEELAELKARVEAAGNADPDA